MVHKQLFSKKGSKTNMEIFLPESPSTPKPDTLNFVAQRRPLHSYLGAPKYGAVWALQCNHLNSPKL